MADERQLSITTRLDASGVRAGMADAAGAVEQGSAQMATSVEAASAAVKAAIAAPETARKLRREMEVSWFFINEIGAMVVGTAKLTPAVL